MTKRKILLIAYYFPPDSNGGVERPLSLSDYLPENGYEVTVLTAGLGTPATCNGKIHYVPSSKNWKEGAPFSRQFFLRIIVEVISRIAVCPLTDIFWQREAKKYFQANLQGEQFDLIYASFPTHDVIFLAEAIRKIIDVPLVIECRDGIGYEPLMKSISFYPLVKFCSRMVERWALKNCSLLIAIGNNMGDYYRRSFPAVKVAVVYNGFREETEKSLVQSPHDQHEKINIAHFGSLGMSRKRRIWPLFKALANLKRAGIINAENFNLTFWGRFTPYEKYIVWRYGVGDLVKLLPQKNKVEGLQIIIDQFDFVLLYGVPDEKTIVTSKLFDYLLVNKPIIGICEGNEAEQMINESGLGEVCGFECADIKQLIIRAIEGEIHFAPNEEYIKRFDRRVQARKIATELDNILFPSQDRLIHE